jgi:hypothetical protein
MKVGQQVTVRPRVAVYGGRNGVVVEILNAKRVHPQRGCHAVGVDLEPVGFQLAGCADFCTCEIERRDACDPQQLLARYGAPYNWPLDQLSSVRPEQAIGMTPTAKTSNLDALKAWTEQEGVHVALRCWGVHHVALSAGGPGGTTVVSRHSDESRELAAGDLINALHYLGIEVPR